MLNISGLIPCLAIRKGTCGNNIPNYFFKSDSLTWIAFRINRPFGWPLEFGNFFCLHMHIVFSENSLSFSRNTAIVVFEQKIC